MSIDRSHRQTYYYSKNHGRKYIENNKDNTHNVQIQIAIWKVIPTDQETIPTAPSICYDIQQKSKSNTI